ncbi:MAG: fibronectin/fibrinogen-binding protein [Lachnospiraceae bacterium]|nr:fibronectin/fibrinogen-binding protein [Lachnospiraceae bacterium]
MPFDGLTTGALIRELKSLLLGGRIDKIYQPEPDEIVLNIRSLGKMYHLLLSADPSHARFQLTERKAETPLTPPAFCMICRKHFGAGKIVDVIQHRADRILQIDVESLNEMGDMVREKIILEIMGKHSNLILVDEKGGIIDCARRVSPFMSSVRAVQPGMEYRLPSHNHKAEPLKVLQEGTFQRHMSAYSGDLLSAFFQVFNGFSPFASREVIERANRLLGPLNLREAIHEKDLYSALSREQQEVLEEAFGSFMQQTEEAAGPYFLYREGEKGKPLDYSLVPYVHMEGVLPEEYNTLSGLLDVFYDRKDTADKMRQKSQDLRHLVQTNLDRARKKAFLQKKQLEDTKDRDKDRMAGDLITANIWQLKEGMTVADLPNYYEDDQPIVQIRLDVNLTPAQNAQKYYARYNKLKRTEEALSVQILQTEEEVAYLESIMASIELADCERDVEDLRLELHEAGYIRKAGDKKKNLARSKPLSFVTSEGVQGYIGKNNIQNDQLTFKNAAPEDEWFHVKDMPGSHVILKVSQLEKGKEYTEQSFLEAARQAAIHSRGKGERGVAVDHTRRVFVKKPAGSRPGFVRYTHQSTIIVPLAEEENS